MQKIRLTGFKKSKNTEEYNKLLEVTGEQESPYALNQDVTLSVESAVETHKENFGVMPVGKLPTKTEYSIARETRLQHVDVMIAKKRGCI